MTRVFLYAQPLENEPHISKLALRKGNYKEGGGVLAGVALTDVGRAAWEALNRIYQDIELAPLEMPVGASSWALRFTTSQFKLVLSRRVHRSLEGARGSHLTLDLDGDKHAISKFLRTFLKTLRRPPWEMQFRPDFRHKTGKRARELEEDWEKFARGISLEGEPEPEEAADQEARAQRKQRKAAPAPMEESAPAPPPTLSLELGSRLVFEGTSVVLSVRVENASSVSVEKVNVVPRCSEGLGFSASPKVVSYLKAGESLTLCFPLGSAEVDGEVWAEAEAEHEGKKLSARSAPRRLRAPLPALEAVEVAAPDWQERVRPLARRDEVRAKVRMPASEAFDEMLSRLRGAGLFVLDPEVIHHGTSYLGHLKLYAEDGEGRPYALALDCSGDYRESKIILHFHAESAELVMALREKVLLALAGKGDPQACFLPP